MAWLGMARRGTARLGMAGVRNRGPARRGLAGRGVARLGMAWLGRARSYCVPMTRKRVPVTTEEGAAIDDVIVTSRRYRQAREDLVKVKTELDETIRRVINLGLLNESALARLTHLNRITIRRAHKQSKTEDQ